tara:strand:+ start:566 stop:703 length:138 start_codon:yes stop_codon:yes gene_type:complete
MDNERKVRLEKAIADSKAKGNKSLTEAVVEALEADQLKSGLPNAA